MANGKLTIVDGGYAVVANYNAAALPVLRALPGARWDKERSIRRVSNDINDLPALLAGVQKLGYTVDQQILDRAAELSAKIEQVVATRATDPRLYPFQKQGVAWLSQQDAGLLADEMGLGKTVQALLALPEKAACVVVCPASLKRNWANETKAWRPDLTASVLSGKNSFRAPMAGEIVIINYDILVDEYPTFLPGTVLVADEVQATKNRKARRTVKFQTLAAGIRESSGRIWILTGTPLMNRPPELWQILDNVGLAERAFTHFGRFFRLFNATKGDYGTEWGMPAPEVPGLLQRVMLRRERRIVLPELPEKTFRTVMVNGLDDKTIKACNAAVAAWEESGDPNSLPAFETMSAAREALARAKVPALLDLVETYEDSEEPVVVFSDHIAPVDELGKRDGWAVIKGGVDNEKRADIVKAFQDGKLKGIALTITAGGTGLTLTRSSHMIFTDLNWVPANNVQAEDRICRIGQDRGCQYTVLTATHALDERVNELLQQKMSLFRATVQPTGKTIEASAQVNPVAAILQAFNATVVVEESPEVEEAPEAETLTCKCGTVLEVRVAGPNAKNPGAKYAKCFKCGKFNWVGEQPGMSEARKAAVLRCLQALAGVCDGGVALDDMGFNRYDAEFGHSLAARSFLTEGQAVAAERMITKYQGQLASRGLWPLPN